MIFILYLIIPPSLSFEYLSAVVHSQDVASLPMRKLWHPHLYLASDHTGEHYEIRHVSQYYDVSISFIQTTEEAEDVPGVMNCECRFVMDEIVEEEETTFLQVMTPSKHKPDPPPPQDKEISIGTYIPVPKTERNAQYVNNENHSGGDNYRSEAPSYVDKSRYRESPQENQQVEYEYRPRQAREGGYEAEYNRGYAREYEEDHGKRYQREYQEHAPYETGEPFIREVPPQLEYYEERGSRKEESRGEPERIEYGPREYVRSEYEIPKDGYYNHDEETQEYYRENQGHNLYYSGERKGEGRDYYDGREEPEYKGDYRHNQEYYGRSSGYNEPVGNNYVRLYDEPREEKIVYVYPYQGR